MISRRTAHAIASAYRGHFTKENYGTRSEWADGEALYDFLYVNEYEPWFCNFARQLERPRSVQDFVMRLHTGETQQEATVGWTSEQRCQLGNRYLKELAEDMLNLWQRRKTPACQRQIDWITRELELDGYTYRDSRVLEPEVDVLDVREQTGVLRDLFRSLALRNEETAFHHLSLSEEHFLASRWDDSISNSRKFLECIAQESAAVHSLKAKGREIPMSVYDRPAGVRDYLQEEGLLEAKEKEALAKIYGLLSHTGSHPYMAASDQARLLRHMSLTFSQFVMLRLQGKQCCS